MQSTTKRTRTKLKILGQTSCYNMHSEYLHRIVDTQTENCVRWLRFPAFLNFGGLWLNEIPEKKMSYLSHRCPRSSASHRAGDFDANLTAGLHKPAIPPPIARSKGANRLILIRALVVHPRNW